MEGSVTPLDLGSKVVEVDRVLHDVLVIVHVEVFKVSLSFAFRLMWSKVIFEFSDKVGVVVDPGWTFSEGQQWFEPVKCGGAF